MRVSPRELMAGQPLSCGSEGPSGNRLANHVEMAGWKPDGRLDEDTRTFEHGVVTFGRPWGAADSGCLGQGRAAVSGTPQLALGICTVPLDSMRVMKQTNRSVAWTRLLRPTSPGSSAPGMVVLVVVAAVADLVDAVFAHLKRHPRLRVVAR
jgi:hypothetical protein